MLLQHGALRFLACMLPLGEARATFQDADGVAYYRNKLTIGSPILCSSNVFSPYLADEIFVRLNDDASFSKNRV